MARTRTREPQLILASVALFALIWFTFLLHPSTYFLFSSLTQSPSDLSDDRPLAQFLLNLDVDDTNPFLPPLITPEDRKYVKVLTSESFDGFLASNKQVVVAFYSPKCSWSRKILPQYAAAAADLSAEVPLAVVDLTKETELASKFYLWSLTVYLFIDGDIAETYDYSWETNREDVVSWVKLQTRCTVRSLMNEEAATSVLADNSTSIIVLAILDSLEGPDAKELIGASKLKTEAPFYMTNSTKVANVFNIRMKIKRPALVIVEKKIKSFVKFDRHFTRWAIADFVSINTLPLVTEYTKENAQIILGSPRDQLWLFAFRNDSEKFLPVFREVAKSFVEELLFVYMEMDAGFHAQTPHFHDFRTPGNKPSVVAYSPFSHDKKLLKADFNSSSIKAFVEDFPKTKAYEQFDGGIQAGVQTGFPTSSI